MPNNYDFSRLQDIKVVEVDPEGWTSPLYVEYGNGFHGDVPAYFWRVKGTEHTFVIPILRMGYLSQGNYEKHFQETLEVFQKDYKGWSEEGWSSDWSLEYKKQYSSFISL